jgi:hypothetical protein
MMALAIAHRFDRSALTRMALAGSAWGLTLAAGFITLNLPQCGLPCPYDVAVTIAVCIGTGTLTIGPAPPSPGGAEAP